MSEAALFHPLRNVANVQSLLRQIADEVDPGRSYRYMEFCGGHTHALFHFGIPELLPENVRMVHGPGCPVCVMSISRIDLALALAEEPGVILCSYGDLLRVPGSRRRSLLQARADGCDVRMVYSCLETIEIAERHPDKQVVFFAIGFETTTPPTAVLMQRIAAGGIKNLSVVCNHVLTPAAIQHILNAPVLREMEAVRLDGFIGPGHVSAIIGSRPYEYFAEEFAVPVVISGFEPADLLLSILSLVRQTNRRQARVENRLSRVVTDDGNIAAQKLVASVFELRKSFDWRGLGPIPYSALRLKSDFREYDAEHRFHVSLPPARENPACRCGEILRGVAEPEDCLLFGRGCTPENPMGSCMVSSEGACAAHFRYRPPSSSAMRRVGG